MATDIKVPTLGESVTEATVAQWLKKPGDAVAADEAVLELETDKVTLEVNAPVAGTLSEILAEEGASVEVGALLGRIGEGKAESAPAAAAPAKEEAAPKQEAETAPAASGSGGDSGGERHELTVPTLGESVTEATVAQWLKQPGDAVAADEAVLELETDKVTLEVNAPVAGTLSEHAVEAGATVEVGALLGYLQAGGAGKAPAQAPAARTEATSAAAPAASEAADKASADQAPLGEAEGLDPNRAPRSGGKVTRADIEAFLSDGSGAMAPGDLSPAVRHLVVEHGLDPTRIPASGKDGRLTKEDVLNVVEGRTRLIALPQPAATAAGAGRVADVMAGGALPGAGAAAGSAEEPREERVKMTKLRQTIARRLKESQNTAAMLTTFNEVDMTAVDSLRAQYKDAFEKKHGTRLGMSCFFTKAVVNALKEIPEVNARIEGDEIVYSRRYDISMAVSTPNGLMVPVLRDCDKKSFAEIEDSLRELAKKGREGKLSMADLQGGTFTITNGGVFGSLLSTPIINMPQSAILGMHKIQDRPVAIDGKVEIRPMMYLALSYDHRIIDGREAVTFLVRIKECLEDPARLLLEM